MWRPAEYRPGSLHSQCACALSGFEEPVLPGGPDEDVPFDNLGRSR
jgi:hypothetical protein